ncbi:putative Fe-Mo cluster-binding NifX family protein [Geothermobacter ehrlichii]|uniref:Putative Fe-Mo cluster-binding NifX family protein n=1 Tax=Geothermobacter ehrlichii TaxID=213224 RepID=A0A5D3WPM5_9BACT|nr:NifB/NifX family molybdenum-iron cluster-binding protein [Geothermobacter ehrlichii]TYO99358.1 putative Fe-Mo cluster-binding NifX family protein [Geothermobacter ehrlichii]
MKICFPVAEDQGLNSPVYGHFGSAPQFIVVDTETREVKTLKNRDQHHAHGACQPLKALAGQEVDAVVVGGIGSGALLGLNRAGLTVYRAQAKTVAENITSLVENGLPELTPAQTCGGHAHGHGHGGGGCHH